MDILKLKKLISKLFQVTKPQGVTDIKFNLDPFGKEPTDTYYMGITYIVPDDSPFLKKNTVEDRMSWNEEIRKTIKGYFNTKIIINSTGICQQSYYNNNKHLY